MGTQTIETTSEVKTPKPRFSRTLSFHLLTLFVALSTCVILVLDIAFTAFFYRATLNDVDQNLTDTANNVVDRYIRHAIIPVDDSTEQHALFSTSDHYIHIHFTTDPFADRSKNTETHDADAASVNPINTDIALTPAAYTVSATRNYVIALPYADDDNDDDDESDDDNDDDDDNNNNSSKTNTGGNKTNTGTGGNSTTGGTGNNNSSTGNSGNTGGYSGINNSGTGGSGNSVSTDKDSATDTSSDNSIVLKEGYERYTQPPDENIIKQYGLPENLENMELALSEKPQTIEGTADSQWRAVSVPILSGNSDETLGYVVIARPLAPVMESVEKTSLYLGIFGLGIVALGSFLAYYLIRRSLRSLHSISESTHAIAAGDLTQRVPSGPKGSEVGMLSDSINVMLNQIEHSFDVKEQSEAKMRQFISDASHELRTPLATVRGYAELYRLGGVPENEMGHAMDRIESESNRMGVLVSDLLQLARLDEGRPLNIETLDVSDVMENALSDFHVRAPEHEVHLIGLDGEDVTPTFINGDKDKIEQIIANLLSNVQTHTPPGTPVDVAVGKALSCDKNNDNMREEAVIEVRDHGAGVPEKEREKIFERFFRTDSSRSRDSGGSGLGLSIVSSVMQAHGGYAQALETDGGGLTIRLAFPTVPVTSEPEVTPASATT